jgi:ABC-type glycerol-3-phosphate transport system substrate-binding protein
MVKAILRYNILMPSKELTLSIMPVASEDHIRPILNQFEDAKNISINLITIDWVNYRSRLVDIAVHNRGADVSAITVPSTSDMISMNALRPYTQAEIAELGGPASFLEGAWRSVTGGDEKQAWAIPWIVDSRYIFYWPELL